jgi:murein DD-endopeptidase MepM/ murein hydrolase activator NlpD
MQTSSSLSASSVSTASGSSTQIVSLQGRLFFDYNGDGIQDIAEPALQNAKVQLKNSHGDIAVQALTDSSGDFKIDAPVGQYSVHVDVDPKFRYMCRSVNEFTAIDLGYPILLLERKTELNIGLMEGFLTLPIQPKESRLGSYVDLDPGPGIRDWKGGTQTYDGHPGTDFLASEGIDVLAVGPGRIFAAASGWPNNPNWTGVDYYRNNGNFVIIDYGNGLYIACHHLKSITVDDTPWGSNGSMVSRGQTIGQVGTTGVTSVGGTEKITVPHLHLQIWNGSGFMHGRVDALDPFRDLYYGKRGNSPWSNLESLWSRDNDPQSPIS